MIGVVRGGDRGEGVVGEGGVGAGEGDGGGGFRFVGGGWVGDRLRGMWRF